MRWRGRSSRSAQAATGAPEHEDDASPRADAPDAHPSLDFRDADSERLRRGIASQVIAEHRQELRRLSGDIDRLSVSTRTAGSLVEDLAANLGREFDRLRASSAAWAQGPQAAGVGRSPDAPPDAIDADGDRQTA